MNDAKTPESPKSKEFNMEDFLLPADEALPYPCLACGRLMMPPPKAQKDREYCRKCIQTYPASLLKASVDKPFDYALKLRTGEVWWFSGAEIEGDYVHLTLADCPSGDHENLAPFLFDRGVDVRARDIVWCADAPNGS